MPPIYKPQSPSPLEDLQLGSHRVFALGTALGGFWAALFLIFSARYIVSNIMAISKGESLSLPL